MSTEFPSNRLSQGNTIQEIEEQNVCSTTEHIDRLRQRNASMASTRIFPAEILSDIFSYIVHDVERNEWNRQCDFVRLGHICSEWRDIILSTPLWSKFRVDVVKELDEETPISEAVPYLPLLLLYINNSRNSPFHLDVVFYTYYLYTSQEILKKLQQYIPNVHTLSLLSLNWTEELPWSSWLSVENLTILFRYAQWTDDKRDISFGEFTRLRHLTIKSHTLLKFIQLPGEQITSLELVEVPINVCMSLLLQCPNLVKFCAVRSCRPEFHRVLQRPETTRNLEYLSWNFVSDPACNSLYHQLRFPSLRYFSWYSSPGDHEENEEMSALRSLVSNFPSTVSQLCLSYAYGWPGDFTEFLFANMRNLKKVDVDECDPSIVISLPVTTQQDE